jgi:DNA polymerase IIIc chi subunit
VNVSFYTLSIGKKEVFTFYIVTNTFRAVSRDLRAHLIHFNRKASVAGIDSKHISSVDNALWQSLEKEGELLELIMLKVPYHPDGQFVSVPRFR